MPTDYRATLGFMALQERARQQAEQAQAQERQRLIDQQGMTQATGNLNELMSLATSAIDKKRQRDIETAKVRAQAEGSLEMPRQNYGEAPVDEASVAAYLRGKAGAEGADQAALLKLLLSQATTERTGMTTGATRERTGVLKDLGLGRLDQQGKVLEQRKLEHEDKMALGWAGLKADKNKLVQELSMRGRDDLVRLLETERKVIEERYPTGDAAIVANITPVPKAAKDLALDDVLKRVRELAGIPAPSPDATIRTKATSGGGDIGARREPPPRLMSPEALFRPTTVKP